MDGYNEMVIQLPWDVTMRMPSGDSHVTTRSGSGSRETAHHVSIALENGVVKISSRSFSNSEASASELLKDLEEMFPQLKSSTARYRVTRC